VTAHIYGVINNGHGSAPFLGQASLAVTLSLPPVGANRTVPTGGCQQDCGAFFSLILRTPRT
jgi:hypothetical protein